MVMIAALLVAILLAPTPAPAFGNDRNEPTGKAPWNATWTDNLKRALLVGYDKFSRPSDHNVSTNVSLGLTVYHIELDDKTAIMTIHGWVKMFWDDDKLKWNASDYGGMHSVHIADHEIWQPDVVQYTSAYGSTVDQYGNTHCIVYENGKVLWVPPAKLTTFCQLDLSKWPRDEQKCTFTFGSWTYDGLQINLTTDDNITVESNSEHYIENGEWELIDFSQKTITKIYACCLDTPYIIVNYDIHVRRRGGGGARGVLVRAPVAVASLLALLSHCLPPRSPLAPRLPLAAASPAILAVSLLYFGYRLPAADTVPDIVTLYCVSLYMVCISGVVSVIVLNMSMSRKALPWTVRKALCSGAARFLRLPKLNDHSVAEELQSSVGVEGSSGGEDGTGILSGSAPAARDWLALATALDRITFIVLLLVFIIIAIVYGC